MGQSSNSPSPLLQNNKMCFQKNSRLGTLYKSKSTQQQYLHMEISPQSSALGHSQLINHFNRRAQLVHKFIPEVVEFQDCSNANCLVGQSMEIWMKHGHKSLAEEIQERLQIKQIFQENQIWVICYSILAALIQYQKAQCSVKVSEKSIFINYNGDVMLTDAEIYLSGHFNFSQGHTELEIYDNIHSLASIIKNLMDVSSTFYSVQLQSLVQKLQNSQSFLTYWQAKTKLIQLKSELDNKNQKKYQNYNCNFQVNALSQFVLFENYQQNQRQTNNRKLQNFKQKFHRTTPVSNFKLKLTQNNLNFTTVVPKSVEKAWSHISQISSINNKTITINDSENREPDFLQIDAVFQTNERKKPNHSKTLSQKNRDFLQNLINKQKDIILEVPESQYDFQSSKSNAQVNQNISLLSSVFDPHEQMNTSHV